MSARTSKSGQNRAEFGEWHAKPMPGFPLPGTNLPHGISDEEICRQYPNHVDDMVIYRLMQKGMGAKAIDALIPAQAGKQKAGQSHSKIQLRIGTIRQHFPDEVFPIPATRRRNLTGPVAALAVDDNQGGVQNNAQSTQVVAEPQRHESPVVVAGPSESSAPMPNAGPSDGLANLNLPARALPLRLPFLGLTSAPGASLADMRLQYLNEITNEETKHNELVLEAFHRGRASPRVLLPAVRAHCGDRYQAECRKVLNEIPSTIQKRVLQNGQLEPSGTFLVRCVGRLFSEVSLYRDQIVHGALPHEVTNRVAVMACGHVLELMRQWTKDLLLTVDINRQLAAYERLMRRGQAQLLANHRDGGVFNSAGPIQAGPVAQFQGDFMIHPELRPHPSTVVNTMMAPLPHVAPVTTRIEDRVSIFHADSSIVFLLRTYEYNANAVYGAEEALARLRTEYDAILDQESADRDRWLRERAPLFAYGEHGRVAGNHHQSQTSEAGDYSWRWRELLEWDRSQRATAANAPFRPAN